MKNRNTMMMGLMSAAALALGAQQAGAVDVYNGIGVDTTWAPPTEYRLMEPVFVTNGATLTIQAGTVIRGETGSTPPGALIIARGAKIRALGTASSPIVFTTEGDDNIGANPGTGVWAQKNNGIGKQWGGVILLGETYIATNVGEPGTPSPNAALQLQIEGITSYGDISKYGGGDDNDDSGEMHYCSIRYGGYVLGGNNEINGLTLGAVGRNTDIDHIEVFQNADDDFEFFGGTVNTKYLVAWCSADDGIDTDEGYRGKGQFLLRVQGPLSTLLEKSDKGTEEDGAHGSDLAQPSSIPTWYNWTQVGMGKGTTQKNTSIIMRDGTGGRFYNSQFLDFGGACALLEGDYGDADGDAASKFGETYVNDAYHTAEANGSKKAEMKYNIWYKMGTNVAFACGANTTLVAGVWGADGTDGNKAHYGYPLFSDITLQNYYLDEGAYLSPVSNLTRSVVPVTISGVNYFPVDKISPLPRPAYANELMTYGRVPPSDGFYTPVAFIGAFGKNKNWAQGWSLASRLGLIENAVAGDYSGLQMSLAVSGGNVVASQTTDVYAGIAADTYLYVDAGGLGWFRFDYATSTWVPVNPLVPVVTVTGPLADVPVSPVLAVSALPSPGTYTFYFAQDLKVGNGVVDFDHTFVKTLVVTRP